MRAAALSVQPARRGVLVQLPWFEMLFALYKSKRIVQPDPPDRWVVFGDIVATRMHPFDALSALLAAALKAIAGLIIANAKPNFTTATLYRSLLVWIA